jgi:hypothetical protein
LRIGLRCCGELFLKPVGKLQSLRLDAANTRSKVSLHDDRTIVRIAARKVELNADMVGLLNPKREVS